MNRRAVPLLSCLLVACVLLGAASTRLPSIKPHPSAYRMANEAACIVEGRVVAEDTVAVTRRHFVAPSVQVPERITVPGLSAMSLRPFGFGKQEEPIAPDLVLLFLDDAGGGRFAPLYLLERTARGVLWLCGEQVYGYRQYINPGPYELGTWEHVADGELDGIATPTDVRAEIALGLAARTKWQATLAIADAKERAAAVARWCSPSTSPDGWRWSERCWPDLRQQARELGPQLVAPLARLVATDADASAVGFAASLLADMGGKATVAAPMVIARLRQPGAANRFDLVRALAALRDPRAIDVLRDNLDADDDFLAAEVALGLHRCGDAEAADRVADRVPSHVDGDHPVAGVVALLDALHEIDAERAAALFFTRFADDQQVRSARRWLRELPRQR